MIDQEQIVKKLGYYGVMLSGSKSWYRQKNPDNFVIFNANICTEKNKVWFGDIDITKSKETLVQLAQDLNEKLFILYEMDGRFDHEDAPLVKKAAIVFNPDGKFEIREDMKQYYSL